MKTSDLLVKALENERVEYVFSVPGEENLDLLESLCTSRIKLITTRHEQVAGFMAATCGRLTGRAGVALSTLGPGATNFVTAAAFAYLGGMPAIFITGQKPITESKQGHFQIIDTIDTMRSTTKMARQLVGPDTIGFAVREAFRVAEEERPGPVHLELPEDIARAETSGRLYERTAVRRPIAEQKAISRAVRMIEKARQPLVLVGAGANRKMVSNMLRQFIDETGIPFFTTQMGKGVVDERHPLFLGTAALSENDYIHCAIHEADLIINVGHDITEKPPFVMGCCEMDVIHINFYGATIDAVYFPQLEVIGDIANALWQLKDAMTPQKHWDFGFYHKMKKRIDKHIQERAGADAVPLLPQRIVADVRRILPEDGILALDNGMYKIWFARNYRAYTPNTFLLDNALATMGAGLPTAMAAKLVYPDKPVTAVLGDGGFMMNSQDLETAVRLGLDLVLVILNDGAYGMIKWKQEEMGFADFGLNYTNPDFVKYAESYSAHGHRVKRADDLKHALKESLGSGGVHLIDVPIDYSENMRVFSQELKEKTCQL